MKYWHFERSDPETQRWTHVKPGDMVHSPGTCGWRFMHRGQREAHNMLVFAHRLLLVLARYEGPPDDTAETGVTTFLCLSRHGLVFIVQDTSRGEEDVDEDQTP